MKTIAHQATLDSGLMTTIELSLAKFYFGSIRKTDSLKGKFFIKNTGPREFKNGVFPYRCSCINIECNNKEIQQGDSLAVNYSMTLPTGKGFAANSIVVIGNCPKSNRTYYFEATIIH